MIKKKHGLRIVTFFAILMFLLIPILSSPVTASFNFGLGSVWTNNTAPPGGPTAGGTITGPPGGTLTDNIPFDAKFSVDYTYTDSYAAGSGSNHWMVITVSWQPGGSGPWSGPVTFTQTTINLVPTASVSGTYTTPWISGYGGKGTIFRVIVSVNCQDASTMTIATWTSNTISFTIV